MTSRRQPPSPRATVRRVPRRASYDRDTIADILDQGMVAHVGLLAAGTPVVLPMAYVRDGEQILLHGSRASRLMGELAAGAPACVTVTVLDGLVLARSAFHHSMNYRSVVALGRARPLQDPRQKSRALDLLVEGLVPGRSLHARRPNAAELKATLVLAFPLDEASAKIRQGPPEDDPADADWPVWAGVIPLRLAAGTPRPDPDLPATVKTPEHVTAYTPARSRRDPED